MYQFIIVDDEPLIRLGTLKKLEPLKDQIHCSGEAGNGKQALKLIEEFHPDLVILDMEMPVMDGTQLLPFLAEHYPDMQLIVISGYKSFDYIKYAISANVIDYILKPFTDEQIQQTVLQALRRLEASESIDKKIRLSEEQKEMAYYEYDLQLIQNLILGYAVSDTAINSEKLAFLRQSGRICLAALCSSAPLHDFRLQEHVAELGFSEMALYLPHPTNALQGFFVLCTPNDADFTPQSFYQRFIQDFMAHLHSYGAVSYWGVSSPCSAPEQLHGAYEKCREALDPIPILQTSSDYYVWHPDTKNELREISWDKKEEFLFRVEAGMTDAVFQLLRELQDCYQAIPSLTLADVKYHYHQLTEECMLILKQYVSQTNPSRSMHNIVREIFSPEELHGYYRQFFGNLSEMLKPQSVYAVNDPIEQIQIYTRRNYQKNLTVEFLASLFYMNSSYLSHLFRKRTGVKYVSYLNSIRIEQAKKLLETTDRKLYQIAKAVGYENNKYFFRVFKKAEGVTPEQYRKMR